MRLQTVAPGFLGSSQTRAPQTAPNPAPAAAEKPAGPEPDRDWTVLLYLNGNNSQSSEVISTMRQLEYVYSNDKSKLVAQVARPKAMLDKWSHDWSGVRRYEIQHNGEKLTPAVLISEALTGKLPGKSKGIKSPVVEDLGNADMGKAQSLEDFLKWGVEKYPAKHYMVVAMGPSEGISGMQHDVVHGSSMSVAELGNALKNVHEQTGRKIDIVNLAGSATNTMEVAYELKDHAKYLVGSQGIQAGGNMPFAMTLNEIQNANRDRAQTPDEVVGYLMLMNSMAGGTLSALDLDKAGAVKESWNQLSQALLDAKVSGEKLHDLIKNTQDFQGRSTNEAYQNSRDAIHFAKLVKDDKDLCPSVKAAAENAIKTIEGAIVGDVATGKYTAEAHGLSVFAPTQYGFFRPDGNSVPDGFEHNADYDKTSFAKDTAWDDVLSKAGQDSGMNKSLKKLGFSEHSIDRLHAGSNKHGGKVKLPFMLASMVGYMNGINAWRGTGPMGGGMVGNSISGYVGGVGAAKDIVDGVGGMIYAKRELKDNDEVVHQAFEVGKAVAKGVASLSYAVPALQPYGKTAGTLMFLSPWIKDFYGIYENYKGIRDGYQLGALANSNSPMTEQWGAAAVKFFGQNNLQDHHERSAWQKLAG